MNESERPEALRFDHLMKKVDADSDNSPLPDIDIAMYEEDVAFCDDLSDHERFNERFIELNQKESVRGNYLIYLSFFFHNVMIVYFVYLMVVSPGFLNCIALMPVVMAWVFMFMMAFSVQGRIRFNRQAQLVHIGRLPGSATTVSWRDVKPYINNHVMGGDLKLFFPVPMSAIEKTDEKLLYSLYKDRPVMVPGHMDWRDTGFSGSVMRLEFYRRYMEKGLEAVQPDPDKIGAENIHPPSPAQKSRPEHGFLLYWVMDPITKVGIFLAGGPLIDRFLRKQADKFYWPEEVERLCAPDADLTGLDTRPVKPRRNVFYRERGLGGIQYVNARGMPTGR